MKSAEAFAELLKKGVSVETALSSLPPYESHYFARVPVEVYRAAQQLGWRFFPVPRFGRPGGNPLIREATNNLETLKIWARSRPYWALATGHFSGVSVLVVDGEVGQNSLIRLCGDDWDWLDTLRTQAEQKRFIFFTLPRVQQQISGSSYLGKGLRVLGDGDWLRFPPSREVNGAIHFFLNPQLTASEPPAWLLDHMIPLERGGARSQSFPSSGFGNVLMPQLVGKG